MNILLIDDDGDFTALMADYLSSEGFECECCSDPRQGLERAMSGAADAVVLDVMMPDLDGIEVLRAIRRQSSLPVLMLTARGDSIDRVAGLELGADDYLPKPVYPRELVARLRAVLRRTRGDDSGAVQQDELAVGPLTISTQRRQAVLRGTVCPLTATEFNIVVELARKPEQVLSKDTLSRIVLNRPHEPYDRSIDVHISNIRHKFAELGGGIEVDTVRAIGYRLAIAQQ